MSDDFEISRTKEERVWIKGNRFSVSAKRQGKYDDATYAVIDGRVHAAISNLSRKDMLELKQMVDIALKEWE